MEYIIFTIVGSAVVISIQFLIEKYESKKINKSITQEQFSTGLNILAALIKKE